MSTANSAPGGAGKGAAPPAAAAATAPATSAAPASEAYAWFVVAILMIAYVFSFVDRQILSLLVGPIRRDLGISDTEMSLLMGLSFALFYTILGIPLGRLADSGSRRGLVTAGVLVWSVMTGLCGLAKQYWTLFACRIGVGVGEAALSPAAYSMIADYFPPQRRATAISVYSMGIYVGSGIAYLVGGLVVHFVSAQDDLVVPVVGAIRPWQLVFFILGGAGILFSAAFLLVREPPRAAGAHTVPLREVLAYLWAHRGAVLYHNFGFALIAMCSYGSSAWVPSFFVRTYGWNMGEVGILYGIIVMLFGSAGIIFGGRLADRWLKQGIADAGLRVGMWAALITLVFGAPYLLMPNGWLSAVAMVPVVFALGMPFGAAPAAIQEIVPPRMRGQTTAVYLFVVNLVGLGVGPTAIALCTDRVFGSDLAVGWSIVLVGSVATGTAYLLLRAGRAPYRRALAELQGGAGPR